MRTMLLASTLAAALLVMPSSAEAQFPGEEECLECYSCYNPNFGWGHWTNNATLDDSYEYNSEGEDGEHFYCKEGHCELEHPPTFGCDGNQTEDSEEVQQLAAILPELQTALRQSDLGELVALARSPRSGARLNFISARSAVQVIGCGGVILAHVPVSNPLDVDRARYLLAASEEWLASQQ